MPKIELNRTWELGDEFASGGFASVHAAISDDGSDAVIKLIPKAPGASRELLFESLVGLPNIVPIDDYGEWEDQYVIVMPRADESLRERLDAEGQFSVDDARDVLADVAEALNSLGAEVVHRDLKPENIVMYEDHWSLIDFGIARYAEASTAPDTQKYAMTPGYASPEQWRSERATAATDIYALGVVAFELLTGALPFEGPDVASFRQQHLEETPPQLSNAPNWLAAMVSECLYKAPHARPTPANILARLQQTPASSSAAEKLQAANKAIVDRRAEDAAATSAQQSLVEKRRGLRAAGEQSLSRILSMLQEQVAESAPSAEISTSPLTIRLGEAILLVDPIEPAPPDCLAVFSYAAPFDVIAYSAIVARKPRDPSAYEGRSHSLWFCDAHEEGVYRWYELAFMVRPSIPQRFTLDPFALAPTEEDASAALTPVITVRQVAWAPIPIDQGEEARFIERWLGWLAGAADGSLQHPRTMPEETGGTWRPPRPSKG